MSVLRENLPGQNHAEGPHEEEGPPPHQRQQPRVRPLLRHQLPGERLGWFPPERPDPTGRIGILTGICLCACVCVMSQELGKTWEEVQSEDDRELVEQDGNNE